MFDVTSSVMGDSVDSVIIDDEIVGDSFLIDEAGDYIVDESGNKIIVG